MTSRQAACEPCRKAKLACDHSRPACSRCKNIGRQRSCIYRSSPFVRRRTLERARYALPEGSTLHFDKSLKQNARPNRHAPPESSSPRLCSNGSPHQYPNPGYLGPSSYVAIFDQIFGDRPVPIAVQFATSTDTPLATDVSSGVSLDSNPVAKQAAKAFQQLMDSYSLLSMEGLVALWNQKGGNLALAEPFVALCAQHSNYSWMSPFESQDFGFRLLENTRQPLVVHSGTTFLEFMDQFLKDNIRWETIGIFLSSVLRATLDVPFFPTLYITETERRQFRHRLLQLVDYALEVCLALDCLHDLQHVLLYENCMIYSFMSGCHSKCYSFPLD